MGNHKRYGIKSLYDNKLQISILTSFLSQIIQ
nr:MAG TPA_asm: hypothetical protein [Caudoviricetes sp.]